MRKTIKLIIGSLLIMPVCSMALNNMNDNISGFRYSSQDDYRVGNRFSDIKKKDSDNSSNDNSLKFYF
ncbi:hypothetical protein [Francisella frigiditurris]|uniref:Uncharacterized protein n=1 Tax=Francisella frigiditurris TaxID=1542390 RepID=A0A1J0KV80_9GAMM|nr:hypothetical protein [Francisella frigiditurris]APC97534.1 hypothetical protein KX01_1643 [Francisella frigiditurris]